MGKQRKATTKAARHWPSVLLSTQTEALYGWKSNFPFPCHSIPGLFLHNTVYNLLLPFFFFKAKSPKPGVYSQLTPPFIAFLLNPGVTSHSLAAAGSFSLLADVSSCRGTFLTVLYFQIPQMQHPPWAAEGKKRLGKSAMGHLVQCTWYGWCLSPFLRYAGRVLGKCPVKMHVPARLYQSRGKLAGISLFTSDAAGSGALGV